MRADAPQDFLTQALCGHPGFHATSRLDSLTRGNRGGHSKQEAAALAGRAFGPDAAAVLLDDAAAEGQAQAGAAESAGVGGVTLLEAVEDAIELLGRDALALVLDDEADFACTGGACAGGLSGGACVRGLRGQTDQGLRR